jgi:splicing factor 3B subunit 1
LLIACFIHCCLGLSLFAVVASALGIPALLPFLKAVCQSKKSWQARHTGIKIVQQIAILMGCAVLPHLKSLVDIVKHGGWLPTGLA